MIAHLSGKILKKIDKAFILLAGEVGYLVHSTTNLLSNLEENSKISLFIHSQIREDAFDLYGFLEFSELEFFKSLININGIGPKVALEILNIPTDKFKYAILNEDEKFISKTPGIGAKTAKRIILELKGKITPDNINREHQNLNEQTNEDIIDALISLGYQKHQILKTLEKLPKEITKEEEIITFFLQHSS